MNGPDAHTIKPNAAAKPRRWRLAAFFIAWTLLAALAVWWLLGHDMSSASLVMKVGGAAKPWTERLREWVTLVHINFHRIYPWVLFAPYVTWLGVRFPFEKRGWQWRVPLLLTVGIGFVVAARELTDRLTSKLPVVMVVSSSSSLGKINIETVNLSVIQRLADDSTLGGLAAALSNPPMASPSRGGVSKQTLIPTNSASTAIPANLPRDATSDTIALLMTSNLVPAVSVQLRSLAASQPRPLTEWSAGLDGLAYIALIGLAHAGLFHRRYREREQQAALLENRLNQARLRTLQAQLQPHFLFNSLNGIATLVRRDPAAAEEMLTSLSDLLRLALGQSGRQEISLREEIEFLTRYLEIQQMRFGDRLAIEPAIEPAALDCAVPALLLQPLVENAIRHGIEPSANPGVVWVSAVREGGRLVLRVEDNGVGLNQGTGNGGTGVGLANVRERLAALYMGQQEFQIGPRTGGGVAVRVSIPWRVTAEGASTAAPETTA